MLYLPVFKTIEKYTISDKAKPLNKTGLILLLIIVFIPQVFIAHRLMEESMMQDLHSRIIGSQLMQANRPAYFFEWKQGDDVRLFDPNIVLPYGLNGVTASPFILWLQLPLLKLSYCNIKLVWWVIEELFLFATLLLTWFVPTKRSKQLITIFLSLVFFCYSRNWWQHIYSGQYYILFGFLFALSTFLSQKRKEATLLIFPLAALVRPFFALAFLPWLLRDLKVKIKWLFMSGVLAIILLVISGTIKYMPEYSKAMKLYGTEITGWNNQDAHKVSRAKPIVMESCVAKMDVVRNFGAGCLFSVQHYFQLFGLKITNPGFFSGMLVFFLFAFLWITGFKNVSANNETLMLASFMIYIFCELFTPANRNPYNMVQYLGVLGLVINRASGLSLGLLILGLALNHDLPFRFAYQREAGEVLILVSIYLALLLSNETKPQPIEPVLRNLPT